MKYCSNGAASAFIKLHSLLFKLSVHENEFLASSQVILGLSRLEDGLLT